MGSAFWSNFITLDQHRALGVLAGVYTAGHLIKYYIDQKFSRFSRFSRAFSLGRHFFKFKKS